MTWFGAHEFSRPVSMRGVAAGTSGEDMPLGSGRSDSAAAAAIAAVPPAAGVRAALAAASAAVIVRSASERSSASARSHSARKSSTVLRPLLRSLASPATCARAVDDTDCACEWPLLDGAAA